VKPAVTASTAATSQRSFEWRGAEKDQPGQRVFDLKLQGKTVKLGFDPVAAAGGTQHALRIEFKDISVTDNLLLELVPANATAGEANQPLLSGLEVLRSDAKEITEQVALR
jgi:hypothetical protein